MGDRTFGGMVVAQALHAAMQTAPVGAELHSLHGYFLRPTAPGAQTTHVVDKVRDGRSFSLRDVRSLVDGKETFRLACSFHAPENGDKYPAARWRRESRGHRRSKDSKRRSRFDPSRGARCDVERRSDGTYESTRRCWFRTREALPDDRAIHACLLTYFSDMTGASFRPLSLGSWGTHTDASLDHAVWFHRPWRADAWSLFDIHTLVNAGGRATIRATMHGEDETLHLSMAQELLIRRLETPLVFEDADVVGAGVGG